MFNIFKKKTTPEHELKLRLAIRVLQSIARHGSTKYVYIDQSEAKVLLEALGEKSS